MAADRYGRDNCGGPKCLGMKSRIVGAYLGKGVIIRLCAECIPEVPGAEFWATKKETKRG